MIVHAGLLGLRLGGRWRGALIEGRSGAGKSDLALRAIEAGFRLVADDRVVLWTCGGRLYGRAPDTLQGLLEVRGLDVVREPGLSFCEVALLVSPGDPERIPPRNRAKRLEVELPAVILPYGEASAPAKLRRALAALYLGQERRM